MIHKAGIETCKPTPTPCIPHHQLLNSEGTLLTDSTLYRSVVGSVQYLTFTRPDIAYAVNTVYQFMSLPTEIHFGAVKIILHYLQGTIHTGIMYSTTTSPQLNAFSDSDWVANLNTKRSITGYVLFLGNNPISW